MPQWTPMVELGELIDDERVHENHFSWGPIPPA